MKTKLVLLTTGIIVGYFVTKRRWSVVHNCLVHPVVGMVDVVNEMANGLHDFTANKMEE